MISAQRCSALHICLLFLLIASCGVLLPCDSALAANDSGTQNLAGSRYPAAGVYHTPLAGEPLHTEFMGRNVDVPALDRGNIMALTLGGTYYMPKQGGNYRFSNWRLLLEAHLGVVPHSRYNQHVRQ